ncbi:hypothetical protein T265_08183 [Opisthorchis viverrini]|uniref:Uncharacterized protein n=1 Tax=Opisthorchis viverrini TaxID=6198 RepID=A0A075A9A3_OPIVI|nr:hypothetical protein T265_08183 [Opisthorchis viverrini]KER24094.1 hypothetical protein T265_08183 [Opisthorchis viverrini]
MAWKRTAGLVIETLAHQAGHYRLPGWGSRDRRNQYSEIFRRPSGTLTGAHAPRLLPSMHSSPDLFNEKSTGTSVCKHQLCRLPPAMCRYLPHLPKSLVNETGSCSDYGTYAVFTVDVGETVSNHAQKEDQADPYRKRSPTGPFGCLRRVDKQCYDPPLIDGGMVYLDSGLVRWLATRRQAISAVPEIGTSKERSAISTFLEWTHSIVHPSRIRPEMTNNWASEALSLPDWVFM